MAAPNTQQWKQHLQGELTTCIPDDPSCSQCKLSLSGKVAFFWDMWSDKEETSLRLQYLYAKLSVIDWLLGHLWPLTNGTLGPLNARCKDRFDNLLALRKLTEGAIAKEEEIIAEPYEFHTVGEF